jgi:hypothetical protein
MWRLLAPVTLGLLLVPGFSSAGEKTHSADEIKWARRLVTDFFETATEFPADTVGLLSLELARSVTSENNGGSFLGKLRRWGYKEWKITSEEVSPDGTELICRGILVGNKQYWGAPRFLVQAK